MFSPKSISLPIIGMIVLAIFVIIAYTYKSVFLDKILVCSFILTTVFLARISSEIK